MRIVHLNILTRLLALAYHSAKAMQYQLVAAQTADELERLVNNELARDWEVTGGLVVFVQPSREPSTEQDMLSKPRQRTWLAQAMIKHGDPIN